MLFFTDDVSVVPATIGQLINCSPVATAFMSKRNRALRPASCADKDGHRLCPITSGSMNAICADTREEIEYCGDDCVSCLEMDGAEDVACVGGTCVATSCKEGWKLQSDRCIL